MFINKLILVIPCFIIETLSKLCGNDFISNLGYTGNRRKQQTDLLRCIVYLLSFSVKRLTHLRCSTLAAKYNFNPTRMWGKGQ